jgi:hypothetical protein
LSNWRPIDFFFDESLVEDPFKDQPGSAPTTDTNETISPG